MFDTLTVKSAEKLGHWGERIVYHLRDDRRSWILPFQTLAQWIGRNVRRNGLHILVMLKP